MENVEDNLGGNTCNVGFIERLIIGSIICMSSCVGRRRSDVLIYMSYYCSPQRYTKDGSVALEMLSYSVQLFFFFFFGQLILTRCSKGTLAIFLVLFP